MSDPTTTDWRWANEQERMMDRATRDALIRMGLAPFTATQLRRVLRAKRLLLTGKVAWRTLY